MTYSLNLSDVSRDGTLITTVTLRYCQNKIMKRKLQRSWTFSVCFYQIYFESYSTLFRMNKREWWASSMDKLLVLVNHGSPSPVVVVGRLGKWYFYIECQCSTINQISFVPTILSVNDERSHTKIVLANDFKQPNRTKGVRQWQYNVF